MKVYLQRSKRKLRTRVIDIGMGKDWGVLGEAQWEVCLKLFPSCTWEWQPILQCFTVCVVIYICAMCCKALPVWCRAFLHWFWTNVKDCIESTVVGQQVQLCGFYPFMCTRLIQATRQFCFLEIIHREQVRNCLYLRIFFFNFCHWSLSCLRHFILISFKYLSLFQDSAWAEMINRIE